MLTDDDFRSTQAITQSGLYRLSLKVNLAEFFYTDQTKIISPSQEILEEFPGNQQDKDKTRLLLTFQNKNKKEPTTITAIDHERFNNTFNIDKFVAYLEKPELTQDQVYDEDQVKNSFFNILGGSFLNLINLVTSSTGSQGKEFTGVATSALCALIAIGFNDPSDIWVVVYEDDEQQDQAEPRFFFELKAIKPRLKH